MTETSTFDLPATMTISSVEALHEAMEPIVLQGCDVVVNGQAVEKIDTAGLQLVLAFKTAMTRQNVNFSWSACSDLLRESAQQLGLSQALTLEPMN